MRIAFDVSPLSHPLLGIGNYIQGSLAGLAEAAAGTHEIVAFAPTSIRGPERIRAALAGIDVEVRTWPLPFSHALRTAWSAAARPAAERLLGDFDVLHFSDWMYPPQGAGVRATTIHDLVPLHHPGVDDRAHPLDARTQVPERRGDVRRRLRELGVHRAGRRRDAGRARGAGSRRASRAEVGLPPRRPGGRPRLAVHPHRGDARAAQEPPDARRGASPTRRRPRARRRRRRGLGRAAAPRRPPDPPTRLRLGRGARAALPWRSRGCLPVSLRGLRDPRARGDGVRRARSSSRRTRRSTRRAETLRCVPTPTIRPRSRRHRARAARSASGSSSSGSRTRRASPGAPSARRSCADTRRLPDDEGAPGGLLVVYRPGAELPRPAAARPSGHGYWHLVAGGIEEGEIAARSGASASSSRRPGSGGRSAAPLRSRTRSSRPRRSTRVRAGEIETVTLHPFAPRPRPAGSRCSTQEHVEYRWCTWSSGSSLLEYPEPPSAASRGAAARRDAMKVGVDTSPLVQTRAGTARHVRGLLGRTPRPPWSRARAPLVRRARESVERPPRRALVPGRALGGALAGSTSSTARPSAARCARDVPTVLTVHDLAILALPGGVPTLASALRPRRAAARASTPRTRSSPSRSSRGESGRARRHPGRANPRGPERRRLRSSARTGPRADGDYVLAVATLEPRKNLARAVEAARLAGSRAACRRRARLGRTSTCRGWVGEIPDAELAALYRGARCVALRVAVRGVRACPCSRRWRAALPW